MPSNRSDTSIYETSNKTIKLIYTNIQGLYTGKDIRRKINYLSDICTDDDIKIIILTESHLKNEIKDEEIKINNFQIYRTDRTKRTRGGVCVYIHETLDIEESLIKNFSNDTCELLILKIKQIKVNLVCLYRPPDTTTDLINEPFNIIEEYLSENYEENIILVGDMNFPFVQWKCIENQMCAKIIPGTTTDSQNQARKLLDLTEKYFMEQLIQEPTREENILDLIFSNTDIVNNINVEKTSKSISDHNIIHFDIQTNVNTDKTYNLSPETQINRKGLDRFSFWSEKSKWDNVNLFLELVDWDLLINESTNIENDIQTVYSKCNEAFIHDNNIPQRKNIRKQVIPKDRVILMRKRRILRQKLKNGNNKKVKTRINNSLIEIEEKLLESHEKERRRNELHILKAMKTNIKVFFKYAKKFTKNKCQIGPLINQDGEKISNPQVMSEILRDQYEKAFNQSRATIEINIEHVNDNNNIDIDDFFNENNAPFSDIEVSTIDVINAIKETKINSAPGPDNFPSIVLHKCKEVLAKPLEIIMNKSIKSSEIPSIWKLAHVIPIHKGGSKAKAVNYRPVSLTSIIAKLLERIIRGYLIKYLETNDAFPDSQHGFRSGRSTVTQLLEQFESIIEAFELNSNIDIIMLDYAKAFDKINISILLHKLKNLGIGGNLGKWLGKFLIGRKQIISVGGHLSSSTNIISGVPQGTILAALLFLVYISDIGVNICHSSIVSYADDSKIYKINKTEEHCNKLQSDLIKLFQWTEENLMVFNIDKFETLRIGKIDDLKKIKYTTPEGKPLPEKEIVKDLGVYINNKGDFTDHIEIIANKARKIAGCILRTFLSRDPEPMIQLFKSLVMPILEYSSIVWSPSKKEEIRKIEKIQQNFTKRLSGLKEMNYHQRLKFLKLYSLERRRERYDLIYAYKILKQMVPNIGLQFKWSTRRGRTLIPPPVCKNSTTSAKSMRYNSFRSRVTKIFNSLPMKLRNTDIQCSMDNIKKMLDSYLKELSDEPLQSGYRSHLVSNSIYEHGQNWVRRYSLNP